MLLVLEIRYALPRVAKLIELVDGLDTTSGAQVST
jgi:hypothetical protein